MKRIDTSTAVPDMFGAGKPGYRDGDPLAGIPATRLNAAAFNNVQEELCNIIEGAGIALDGTKRNQVFTAIQAILRDQLATAFTSAGTASAYTLTPSPALTVLAANTRYRVKFHVANNGAASTLAVSGLVAKSIKQYDASGVKVAAVIAAGQLADVEFDGVDYVIVDPLPGMQARQVASIAASVAANALTFTLNPTTLDFRATALNSGAVNTRSVSAAVSLVVPSGATLGTINGQAARLALLAIDNAGTVELAVTNIAGGVNLDETTLISTTAISAAASSASTVYSATARNNVPFRVVGYIDITQASAGVWATAPTLVQGAGGLSAAAFSSFGYGQTWQGMSGLRAMNTVYYNLTGKPIFVFIVMNGNGPGSRSVVVSGISFPIFCPNASNASVNFWFPVPPGGSYMIDGTFSVWNELR